MLYVISPAKTLDFETPCDKEKSYPRFQKETLELIGVLRQKSPEEIQELMSLSENLAELNVSRYQKFAKGKNTKRAKQAVYAFKGDVYLGLEAEELSDDDILYAQGHLRILSGLYGLLRPLDLIQPYRLEMGTRLAFDDYNTLYNYWSDRIVAQVNRDLKRQGDKVLVNLASQEYFKAIDRPSLKAKVVNVEFLDQKNGKYKVISFFAKKARGLMAQFIIKNKIEEPEALKAFDYEGYWFDAESSHETKLVFKRDEV
ncbi:peroxide stress protein YaaA [Roseivirga sp. E12]|uniref:peroxide stress protein YaaA n=1 Tax=Roseivirga sp. E12 TaxID=2819237 RepID=UPI001ABC742E|nr:peroxide stress protein YaaA [Roseivirga sp. E12]MBO3697446.1 peroxide stress protein YaaA [Roseivirga sp. E12]